MISIKEALKITFDHLLALNTIEIDLNRCLNHVLHQDILSNFPIPPFNKASSDGFALNFDDTSREYEIIENIGAGICPKNELRKGQCARIMSGAQVPSGTTHVIRFENCEVNENIMKILEFDQKTHIIPKGKYASKDELILEKGTWINPYHIGIIAELGFKKVLVNRSPKIGILATGSELIHVGEDIKKSKIFNSNTYLLSSLLDKISIPHIDFGIVKDDFSFIVEKIEDMQSQCDLLLVCGGASRGDFDWVNKALQNNGFEILFNRVAIKPGKPLTFGAKNNKIAFGLPGNPISNFVCFEIFIRPYLIECMKGHFKPLKIKGKLEKTITREKSKRPEFLPVYFENQQVKLISYSGPSHLLSLNHSNGLLKIEKGIKEIKKGSEVIIRLI